MTVRVRKLLVLLSAMALCGSLLAAPATGQIAGDDRSSNMTYEGTSPKSGTTNSDLAFWGNRVYAANYDGFRIIDITNPRDIENPANVIAEFSCPGPQNDISVWDRDGDGRADLAFLGVDSPRFSETGSTACGAGGLPTNPPFTPEQNAAAFEGVRIIDMTDETAPVQIAAVPTDCGSHTQTLVPGEDGNLYIYVSSYPTGGRTEGIPAVEGTNPRPANTRNDGTRCLEPHNQISIIRVPLADPASAATRDATGAYTNVKRLTLPSRQNSVTSLPVSATRTIHFRGCHDITVFTGDVDRAAGACWREALIWDIADPWSPHYLRGTTSLKVDQLFHSATFSWDAKIIAFEDESGGGGGDRCHLEDGKTDEQGAMYFYDRTLDYKGLFKIPRDIEKECTAHNYNVLPLTNGRYVLSSAWYTGGTSMVDFTDPSRPREVGHFIANSPVNGTGPAIPSDTWSSYWYNGFVYANDGLQRADDIGERGLDVLSFNDPLTETAQTLSHLNPQTQEDTIAQTYSRDSDITLGYVGRTFEGTISSQDDACSAGREVVIKKERAGRRSLTVGRATSDADGHFSVAVSTTRGRYFAVAKPSTTSDGENTLTCTKARSGTIRL